MVPHLTIFGNCKLENFVVEKHWPGTGTATVHLNRYIDTSWRNERHLCCRFVTLESFPKHNFELAFGLFYLQFWFSGVGALYQILSEIEDYIFLLKIKIGPQLTPHIWPVDGGWCRTHCHRTQYGDAYDQAASCRIQSRNCWARVSDWQRPPAYLLQAEISFWSTGAQMEPPTPIARHRSLNRRWDRA